MQAEVGRRAGGGGGGEDDGYDDDHDEEEELLESEIDESEEEESDDDDDANTRTTTRTSTSTSTSADEAKRQRRLEREHRRAVLHAAYVQRLRALAIASTAAASSTPTTPTTVHLSFPRALPALLQANPAFASSRGPLRIFAFTWLLATLFACGVVLASGLLPAAGRLYLFGWYLIVWTVFHVLEFVLTALFHPFDVGSNSFLLNHSRSFHIALLVSLVEFFVELWLFPTSLKAVPDATTLSAALSSSSPLTAAHITLAGLLLCAAGQLIRSTAMWHASTNFTHLVATARTHHHQLITTGLYAWCRHPSYAGWFAWAIGTQLVLVNPLCTCAYAYVAWRFFAARIDYEEWTLVRFFGDTYRAYQQRVPATGVPFVRGYVE